ncbi:M15 family metallopeptidase [Macrococcus capreoli]|uniref:M15 family metallopeptidase n=1 Tax=Macrococcus capreoli TaxID=2982690 RepID=UPI0021D59746|nr:M15 family metallopeptidase [Macrococcus sp. TMW 2.2395]MCU7557824.1 M15 family metallopeptidase [Macrococcus sp. TMW 2.2395]
MKKTSIILCTLLLASCNQLTKQADEKHADNNTTQQSAQTKSEQSTSQQSNQKHKRTVKQGVTYIDGILIVNKEIALPQDYAPGENQEARAAVDTLMAAGNQQGLHFALRSGFRSYETQASLYNSYVARDGQAKADMYSAKPGHSEHQTGLAFDLGNEAANDDFKTSFEQTAEGKWLKEHAHEYGFIIRYPKGQTDITGYQYEPWHLRYLGKETAQKVQATGLTLEEYLGLK